MDVLKFYLLGCIVAFIMVMDIFAQTKCWEEEDGKKTDKRTKLGVLLVGVVFAVVASVFSWIMVAFIFLRAKNEKGQF